MCTTGNDLLTFHAAQKLVFRRISRLRANHDAAPTSLRSTHPKMRCSRANYSQRTIVINRKEIDLCSDHYFINSRRALAHAGYNPRVLYQIFQRHDAVLCGMKYVLDLLWDTSSDVEIYGLKDGERVAPKEPVMHLIGPAQEIIVYETLYLGLLARMTKVCTNVRIAVEAAAGKPVLFFPARFDIPEAQEYDGYAAKIGGCAGASTAAEARAFNSPPVGTMPHALIAAYKGNTVAACLALADALPQEPIWALVDFVNDSAQTAVDCFLALRQRGARLTGVRLDTSQDLVDASLARIGNSEHGVTEALVFEVRHRLDEVGGHDVQIAVSGGFTAEKIRRFEAAHVPVNVYAVGERFFAGSIPFTSDIVGYYEGEKLVPCAKVGREFRENPRFQRLK
jgi:nicotinate phosphoribosyltransferase